MRQEIKVSCPGCSKEGVSSFGQSVFSGRLRWYRSTSCPACGQTEEDGEGFAPAKEREQLLELRGSWRLMVDPSLRVRALKVLRGSLGLSLEETGAIVFPEVFAGTHAEAQWLALEMLAGGIAAEVEPHSPEGNANRFPS